MSSTLVDPFLKKYPNGPARYLCSICEDILQKSAITTKCKHRFCGDCILRHLCSSKRCPVCHLKLKRGSLARTPSFDIEIDYFLSGEYMNKKPKKYLPQMDSATQDSHPVDNSELAGSKIFSDKDYSSSIITNFDQEMEQDEMNL